VGQTKKRKYDRYTLAYKLQAVRLANHPGVKATDVAESLGIHVVMLYRWQMEYRRGDSAFSSLDMDSPSHCQQALAQERSTWSSISYKTTRLQRDVSSSRT
jgi:transposase-like protein